MEKQTTLEERFGLCPYATAQSLISGKWAVLILHYLEEGPTRFNELLRKMPKMTHATLSVQLKALEEHGLVKRVQYEAIPPRVEYSLTEIGTKFHPVIAAMETWGNEYIAQMKGSVRRLRIATEMSTLIVGETTVAMAAPAAPMCSPATSSRSPAILQTLAMATVISGVRESPSPRMMLPSTL